jgi:hypothetical protein
MGDWLGAASNVPGLEYTDCYRWKPNNALSEQAETETKRSDRREDTMADAKDVIKEKIGEEITKERNDKQKLEKDKTDLLDTNPAADTSALDKQIAEAANQIAGKTKLLDHPTAISKEIDDEQTQLDKDTAARDAAQRGGNPAAIKAANDKVKEGQQQIDGKRKVAAILKKKGYSDPAGIKAQLKIIDAEGNELFTTEFPLSVQTSPIVSLYDLSSQLIPEKSEPLPDVKPVKRPRE